MELIRLHLVTFLSLALLFIGVRYLYNSISPPLSYQDLRTATTTDIKQKIITNTAATSTVKSEEIVPKTKQTEITAKPKTTPKPTETLPEIESEATKPVKAAVAIQTSAPPFSTDAVNDHARNVLVNIFCVAQPGLGLPSFTGSGVIIDPRGIIITNAHVAEHMLLKDYKVPHAISCTIRNGAPARAMYKAELMYLPPSWIEKNANQIKSLDPSGIGEDDYAFLYITESATDAPLPFSFPYIPIEQNENNIATNELVLVAGYPAGFLSDRGIENALYPITTLTNLGTFFTFSEETLDLMSLGGTAVSQKGSSGGGAVNLLGNLIGLIVTSTDSNTTAGRDLRAITFSHISRSLMKNTNSTLSEFLSKDPATTFETFKVSTAPTLTQKLIVEFEK